MLWSDTTMCSRSGLMSHFFLLSILWDVLQVHTSPDMFALVASIKCLRVLYFILSDVQSAAMASREAMVPCNIYTVQKRAHRFEAADPSNLLSCLRLHLSCSSDLDLDCDTYQEDYYDRYCQKAAAACSRLFMCRCRRWILHPWGGPHPPTSVCCLLHSCQEPKSEELNHMMNTAFTYNTYWETCRSRIVTNWLIKADWQY